PPAGGPIMVSILHCADVIIIPINPDGFAVAGLRFLLTELKLNILIDKTILPTIFVLMNKAQPSNKIGTYTKETERFSDAAKIVVKRFSETYKHRALFIDKYIPETVAIKRVFKEGLPSYINNDLHNIWKNMEEFI
ncbi:MAG: hypothetical protein L3V56_14920, partial [Candidatus Magnetoovum sp. WYHC-5]|nr:hypothetical protein [Candidatus Magnetoovum sp. WYHC-5]